MAESLEFRKWANAPPRFEGKQGDDFLTWSERFEVWADSCSMKEEERVSIFPTLLGDAAFLIFRNLNKTDRGKYAKLKSVFTEAFASDVLLEAFRAELFKRDRKCDENLAVYAGELKRLVSRAYPKYNDEAKNDVVLTHFLRGIAMGKKVRNKNPKDVEEAVKLASKLECRVEVDPSSMINVNACEVNMKGQLEQTREMVKQSNEAIQNLQKQLEDMAVKLSAVSTELTNKPPRGGQCYRCGLSGHYARECGNSESVQTNMIRGRGRGGYGNRGMVPNRQGRGQGTLSHQSQPLRCFTCGGVGHIARSCPTPLNF